MTTVVSQPSAKQCTLGIKLSTLSFEEALNQLIAIAQKNSGGYVCFANAHMTVEAYWDQAYAAFVNQAHFVFPDGQPLVWALKLLHQQHQERIAGMDMFPALLREAATQHLSVFFYGSTPKILDEIRQRILHEYPNLTIAGMISPPFRDLTVQELAQDIHQMNQSGAKLIFVSLGCPKQEKWMAKHSPNLSALVVGIGGAFPVFAQVHKRAPKWMRSAGLEWLFRLIQEPKRLWKRYLVTNTIFISLFLKRLIFKK
ncbi:MAG: WecB/TagA/CpsF family glycosyltransferase [Flammeovirgaceae bacterium]